jgi:ABC-type dipeptide/oligopeptide/nickel transport system ATPase component
MTQINLQIDITNPDAITYITDELGYTILGGIRLEGLDRLRVTMKTEVVNRKFQHYLNNPDIAALAIRQNLDLYSITQTEKLARLIAERLEVGVTQVSKDIDTITGQLELYRLMQIEQKQEQKLKQLKILTAEEIKEATEFLQAKSLMQHTNDLIGKSGVVGEELNRLIMYLIFINRKREKPLHIISFGSSGAGKSYLQEKLAELVPEEHKIESTSLTSNALYYYGTYDLRNKLLLIEDMDGASEILYALRELMSKSRITKIFPRKDDKGITRTTEITVNGPVTVAGCTTQEKIYEDNANRSFLIYIDESSEQDEKIMEYQRRKSAGSINTEEERKIKELLQNTQRILKPITIKNPYAEFLKIPGEVFKPRRSNSHYLQFIEAVTFYHQYQREHKTDATTGEIFIETTLEDIAEANKLMKQILLRKSDELNNACRSYLEQLKTYLQQNKRSAFTSKEIRQALRINASNQKRYMLQLFINGYIKKSTGSKAKGFMYEVVSYEEYAKLQNSISNVLDEILHKLQPVVHGSTVVQKRNGLLKHKPDKVLAAMVQ